MSQTGVLRNIFERVCRVSEATSRQWGWSVQVPKAREEMAELLLAIERSAANRGTDADVVEEAADVIITAVSVGIIYGGGTIDKLLQRLNEKAERLEKRLPPEAL